MNSAETATSQKGGQCHHVHQRPAEREAVATRQPIYQATASNTKVKAGNPTSQVNHANSVDTEQSGKSSGRGY